MDSFYSKIPAFLWAFVLVCVVTAGLIICRPKFDRRAELAERRAEIENRIKNRRAEIDRKKEECERFKRDPAFVEAVARKNRRVFPGETVFLFED